MMLHFLDSRGGGDAGADSDSGEQKSLPTR